MANNDQVRIVALDIRDHFAGQAMQAIIQSEDFMEAAKLLTDTNKDLEIQEAISMMAYGMADTMIIERDKKEKEQKINSGELSVKGLTSLSEHNASCWSITQGTASISTPNGIACPECGEELMDTNPNVILTSDPAQKHTHCPKCKYKGYRFV